MANRQLDVVSKGLRGYAERGVFRGFSERNPKLGKRVFTFQWLTPQPVSLSVDSRKGVLTFRNLLPNVRVGSELHLVVRRFLLQLSEPYRPAHRRVDPGRAEVGCSVRADSLSISLKVKRRQYAYAQKTIVNLVHELFVFLNDSYADYMCENFETPQE
jgi:hypothetical protein